jgi:hypothetical protein
VTWSRDLVAADAVGVLTDADRLGLCGGDVAPVHLRITDGQSTDMPTDQLGRVTVVYVALGTLPALRLNGMLTICDRDGDGAPVLPGEVHQVLDIVTRGPFHVVSVSSPRPASSGTSYS